MINLKNVALSFDRKPLLHDVSFDIDLGERVSLVGPGGSGKSTILKMILGLLKPDSGSIHLMETDMVHGEDSDKEVTLKKVGMAFQQGALFDFMTVKENLLFAMENMTEMGPSEMVTKVKNLLAGVKLGRTENMYPHELSGGMQRRVGIARALATNPTVAIFDEPTSGLDPVTSTIILNMILELSGSSQDSVQMIVTSNVEIGIRFAERILVLNDGRIVADGPWRDLLIYGTEWVRHFLGTRFIGLDLEYARELRLPEAFIERHWSVS